MLKNSIIGQYGKERRTASFQTDNTLRSIALAGIKHVDRVESALMKKRTKTSASYSNRTLEAEYELNFDRIRKAVNVLQPMFTASFKETFVSAINIFETFPPVRRTFLEIMNSGGLLTASTAINRSREK